MQLIIADMMFNMGYSQHSETKTILRSWFKNMKRAVLRKDWSAAANEMVNSRWYGQVGNRSRDLVRRMRNVRSI